MPAATRPDTDAIADAIESYFSTLTYPDGSQVYKLSQVEQIKDVTDVVANGGVCVEVYGNQDDSERRGFGGRMWDEQSWLILSLCSVDTPALARQIYRARDAAIMPFQLHAQLGNQVDNLFHAQIKPQSAKFLRILRNAQFLRAHVFELITRQEWYLPVPPGVIS